MKDRQIYALAAAAIIAALGGLLAFEVLDNRFGAAVSVPYVEPERTAVQMMLDLSKSFATWAVGLIGAAAFFVKSAIDKPGLLSRSQILLIFAVIFAAFVSIFFSQLVAERIYLLIIYHQAPESDDKLHLFLRAQYLAGLGGIGFFAFFLFQAAWSKLSQMGTPNAQ